MTVVFRDEAISDLEDIASYIAQHDPAAAARVIARIHRVIFRTIDRLPLSGHLDAANQTREFSVPGLPYLIVYLPVGKS
jgi:plasmid stabilization system protein ParE